MILRKLFTEILNEFQKDIQTAVYEQFMEDAEQFEIKFEEGLLTATKSIRENDISFIPKKDGFLGYSSNIENFLFEDLKKILKK